MVNFVYLLLGKQQFWRHIDKQLNDYETLGHEELMKPWIQHDSKFTPPNAGSGDRAADQHPNVQNHNNRPSGSRSAQNSNYSFNVHPLHAHRNHQSEEDIWGQAGCISRMEHDQRHKKRHQQI